MARRTFLYAIDRGLQTLLYVKFGDILDLDSVNKGVLYNPKEIALREKSEKEGRVELEFINVWRTMTRRTWERQRTAMGRRGLALDYVDSVTKTDINIAKGVPVHLEYTVWFWTLKKDKLNELAETYLLWQHSDPNLYLNWLDTYPVEFDLHFGEMLDESTIREKYEKGTIYCMSAPVIVDGWVFELDTEKAIHSIHLTYYDQNDLSEDTSPTYEEIIVEDSNQDVELEAALKIYSTTITE